MSNLTAFDDMAQRTMIRTLVARIEDLERRLESAVSDEGVISGNLPLGTRKDSADGLFVVATFSDIEDHIGGFETSTIVDSQVAAGADIEASKILVSDTTTLDTWRKTGDLTKIDGAAISAATVTVAQMADDSVDTDQIADDAVGPDQLAAKCVRGEHLSDAVVQELIDHLTGGPATQAAWDLVL